MKEVELKNKMFYIFRVLYVLLHACYSIVVIFQQAWARMRRLLIEIYNQFNNACTEVECLVQCTKKIDKLPNHLVIILGRKRISFRDIVRVVGWCATAGIPCISFYDHHGLLRKNEDEVWKELARSRPDLVDHINWSPMCPVKAVKNGMNGVKPKLHVQLLSYLDGKPEVILLAQSLGKGVISGALKVEEISQELIENKLQLGGLPDPDLAIIFGKTCSTYGLLPWHIRTTEFLLLENHHNIQVIDFVQLLEKYAKCEQRYGK